MANHPSEVWQLLLVDGDEEHFRRICEMLAQVQGQRVEVEWASTYRRGQHFLQSKDYHAVLVIDRLGLRSGIELIRETAAQGYPAPLILMTGQESYEEDIAAMEAGASFYLTEESLSPHSLERSIRYAIERKRIERELERRRTEEALIATNKEAERNLAQLQTIIHNMSDGLIIADAQGNILLVNEAMLALSGMQDTPQEDYRQYAATRIEVRDPQGNLLTAEAMPLARALRGETVRNIELSIQRQDTGKSYTALYNAAPVLDPHSGVQLAILTVRDITERKKAVAEAEEGKRILDTLMEYVPEGITIANAPDGKVRMVSRYGQQLLGGSYQDMTTEAIAQQWTLYHSDGVTPMKPEDVPLIRAIQKGEAVRNVELVRDNTRGQHVTLLCNASPIRSSSGEITGGIVAWRDITERKQAEQMLKAALAEGVNEKNRLLAVMEALPIGLAILDEKGGSIQVNRAYKEMWGEPRPVPTSIDDYVAYKSWWLDTGQPVRPEEWASAQAVQKGATVVGQLMEIQRFDGQRAIILNSGAPIRDAQGRIIGSAVAIMDITTQKQLETEQRDQLLQMELQRRLLEYRDQERQKIARDLHDGPIQDLFGLLFNVQCLKESITDPEVKGKIDLIALGLKGAGQNLREMMNEMRPPSLIRFGLARALQGQLEEFMEKHPDIAVEHSLMEDNGCLSEQARLNLFRIFQEALNNAVKHAHATKIIVRLKCTDRQLVLEIQDNGKGFPIPVNLADYSLQGHYGLVGMKERAQAIGSALEIHSQPEQGSLIRISVPLDVSIR